MKCFFKNVISSLRVFNLPLNFSSRICLKKTWRTWRPSLRPHGGATWTLLKTLSGEYSGCPEQRSLVSHFGTPCAHSLSCRSSLVELDIFYKDLSFHHTEQSVSYSLSSFFSDVGGFMGLLLGGSIMTLVEILDCIILGILNSREKSTLPMAWKKFEGFEQLYICLQ